MDIKHAIKADGDRHMIYSLERHFLVSALLRASAIREQGSRRRTFAYSERHLQCIWADPGIRPASFITSDGERARVEHSGTWNLEAGPDFQRAVIGMGQGSRSMAADVEIHIRPVDWIRHGHSEDSRYNRVGAHVTWFDGALPPGVLPPGCIQIAMKPVMEAVPGFSFETIDVTAYPYGNRAARTPCSMALSKWDPDQKRSLLKAAGEERIRRKAESMSNIIRIKGRDQALYEGIMTVLGYKNNKRQFRNLAETLDLATLRQRSDYDPVKVYALILGCAGLIPYETGKSWDIQTQRFVRRLRDIWWRFRDLWTESTIAGGAWRFDGIRPMNHPARRLMAAAVLFTQPEDMSGFILRNARENPDNWMAIVLKRIEDLYCPYWSYRSGWNLNRHAKRNALIGPNRAAAVMVNVILPFLSATYLAPGDISRAIEQLPLEPGNSIIRRTAVHLFGSDHPDSLYNDTLRRQGLIQIFQDFCLNDRTQCKSCPLPKVLSGYG